MVKSVVKSRFWQDIRFMVKSGQIRFWKDLWVGEATLSHSHPNLFSLAANQDVSVALGYKVIGGYYNYPFPAAGQFLWGASMLPLCWNIRLERNRGIFYRKLSLPDGVKDHILGIVTLWAGNNPYARDGQQLTSRAMVEII
ncbi:hypothetical protein AMTR_s00022p00241650 [Amborella trichopoda]|uniref:Reverse transcriptase zinc-binding domain-containing protein n=1 Tax=Amborella trichopoda TaxID=13333 RepID=W1PVA7_AMBTC|nr:hypothetical protein AMTR_s00022p00241650 [Amborella trichopoda]